jgi:hypothetical protein
LTAGVEGGSSRFSSSLLAPRAMQAAQSKPFALSTSGGKSRQNARGAAGSSVSGAGGGEWSAGAAAGSKVDWPPKRASS